MGLFLFFLCILFKTLTTTLLSRPVFSLYLKPFTIISTIDLVRLIKVIMDITLAAISLLLCFGAVHNVDMLWGRGGVVGQSFGFVFKHSD